MGGGGGGGGLGKRRPGEGGDCECRRAGFCIIARLKVNGGNTPISNPPFFPFPTPLLKKRPGSGGLSILLLIGREGGNYDGRFVDWVGDIRDDTTQKQKQRQRQSCVTADVEVLI